MKKIGIVTLYQDNFGSILQAYSTYYFLKKEGYSSVLLEYTFDKSKVKKILKVPGFVIKCICYPEYIKDRKKVKNASKKDMNLLSKNTKRKMDEFIRKEFEIEECNSRNISSLSKKYDYFITGSDQVWNGYNSFKFLEFTGKKKKISLAASFGSETIKAYFKDNIKNALKSFEEISVREESGVRIVKELTGKDAIRLADPTILFTKQEWRKFATNGMKKKNYVLLHFLNEPSEVALKIIAEYLKKNKCIVYCICNNYKVYNGLLECQFIDVGPEDYISLIDNAEFVFTDSFHSTLFSINLETQFVTFERQYLHGNSQSSRIENLLKRVNMIERYVQNENFEFGELYSWNSNELFFAEREKIKNYLKRSLK